MTPPAGGFSVNGAAAGKRQGLDQAHPPRKKETYPWFHRDGAPLAPAPTRSPPAAGGIPHARTNRTVGSTVTAPPLPQPLPAVRRRRCASSPSKVRIRLRIERRGLSGTAGMPKFSP